MWIEKLSDLQRAAVLQCVRAIAESQLIEDWEIRTRLGISRETLSEILARWPNIDDTDDGSEEFLAINNCMNEVCHGVRISTEEWDRWFTVTRSQVLDSYRTWLTLRGNFSSGIR